MGGNGRNRVWSVGTRCDADAVGNELARPHPIAPGTHRYGEGVLSDVQVVTWGAWVVVAPVGELDLASVPRLRQEVVALVGDGHRNVVLDLAAVDFIDSVGLGGVVAVAKRVRGAGGRFRVARPDQRVWSVFELVGLDAVIERFDDLEAATGGPPGAVDAGRHDRSEG